MAVYKEDKTGTWRVIYRYTDWNGERKQTQKRGFKTRREAQAWEHEQLNKKNADLDMKFKSFVELYTADVKTRLKENTWATKEHIIRTKLEPYFGKLKMCAITPQQIITWQNELINYRDEQGKAYSPVYLKTVNNQLSAIFNHAVKRFKPLYDELCSIKWKSKREQFKSEYESELRQFYMAHRKLRGGIHIAEWRRELGMLERESNAAYAKYKAPRDELSELLDVKYCIVHALAAREAKGRFSRPLNKLQPERE